MDAHCCGLEFCNAATYDEGSDVDLEGRVRQLSQYDSLEQRGNPNCARAGDRSNKFKEPAAAAFTSMEQELDATCR